MPLFLDISYITDKSDHCVKICCVVFGILLCVLLENVAPEVSFYMHYAFFIKRVTNLSEIDSMVLNSHLHFNFRLPSLEFNDIFKVVSPYYF